VADPKTKTDAIAWIERKLGGGTVVLEINTDHLDDAFDDAVRWYVSHKGIKRHAVVNLVPGVQDYFMTDDTDEVIQVWFPGVQLDIIAAVNPYAFIDVDQLPIATASMTGVPGGQFYGTLHQILSHAETARRIVGSEPAWEYRKDTNKIHVFPRNQRSGSLMARYASTRLNAHDPDDAENNPDKLANDLVSLPFRERDMILRWALAETKARLGRVRAKYPDGMPSAGGTKQMDGDTLLGEAETEKEKLQEELMGLSLVPFVTG
jgi:hypothetical protein